MTSKGHFYDSSLIPSSDWIWGKDSSHIVWPVTRTGSPGKWLQYQPDRVQGASECTLNLWFSFRWSCWEQGVGLSDCFGPLPTWEILWILFCPVAHIHVFYPSGSLCTFEMDAWLMYCHLWSFTGHTSTPLKATLLLKNDISLLGKARLSFSFWFLRAIEHLELYLFYLSSLALYQPSLLCFEHVKKSQTEIHIIISFQELQSLGKSLA